MKNAGGGPRFRGLLCAPAIRRGKGNTLPRTLVHADFLTFLLQQPFVGEAPAGTEDAAGRGSTIVSQGQVYLRAQAATDEDRILHDQVQGGGVDEVAGQTIADTIPRAFAALEAGIGVIGRAAEAGLGRREVIIGGLRLLFFRRGLFFFIGGIRAIDRTGFKTGRSHSFSDCARRRTGRRAARSAQNGGNGGDDRNDSGGQGPGMLLPGVLTIAGNIIISPIPSPGVLAVRHQVGKGFIVVRGPIPRFRRRFSLLLRPGQHGDFILFCRFYFSCRKEDLLLRCQRIDKPAGDAGNLEYPFTFDDDPVCVPTHRSLERTVVSIIHLSADNSIPVI